MFSEVKPCLGFVRKFIVLATPQDSENGSWNCLDFFVVLVSYIEMTPARVIFEAVPVVVLRLLRLLRVFRLAKALPRLRSIVEALISGFSAVGGRGGEGWG